jgi:uncharacterized protein YaeQ
MALQATIHTLTIELADSDRGVYERLELRVARHPSESPEYLVTRVLAYALERTEGIEFTAGLSDPDEPAISVRDLTGVRTAWIDVGAPEAARLHRASKAVQRVAVYTHKDPERLVARLSEARVHRAEALEIYAVDRDLVRALADRLVRRMSFGLAVSDRELYVSIDGETLTGSLVRHPVGGRLPGA